MWATLQYVERALDTNYGLILFSMFIQNMFFFFKENMDVVKSASVSLWAYCRKQNTDTLT